MTNQEEPLTLEKIPETIQIGVKKLIVIVKWGKPRCFECGKKCHIRAECYPPWEETNK